MAVEALFAIKQIIGPENKNYVSQDVSYVSTYIFRSDRSQWN